MNTVKWLVAVGLAFTFFSSTSGAFTIDGTLDPGYGSAIATQALGTADNGGAKNYLGDINQSAGSELDAGYGVITNGVLYLFLAGNLDSGEVGCTNGCLANDKLNIFFMSDTGAGGDNPLGTNYNSAADSGGINRMGVGGDGKDPGSSGLTFDAGFTANYWISVTMNPTNLGNTASMSANYEVICSGCPGYFLGKATPPSSVLIPSGAAKNPYGIQIALNNSNTNGVQGDASGCEATGLPFGPQSVNTGVELSIPLAALGNPLTSVSICAFVTKSDYSEVYNQVLGPVWDGTPGYCVVNLAADGDSSEVNFQSLPGTHSFAIPVPACNSIQANPTSAVYPATGGSASETVSMSGSCPWTVSVNSASTNWLTITSSASGSGNGSFTYSASANTSIGPRTATITVAGQVATQTVSVAEDGLPLPITIDGSLDQGYGCPLSVQTIGTSFGTNATPNAILAAGGSELDAAYGLIENNILYLFLAGNLQDNGNRLHIFFMTGPGGSNTIGSLEVTNVDVSSGRSVLNWMGPTNNIGTLGAGPGLTFDPGFAPTYWMDVVVPNATSVTFNYAQLWPGGTNASGLATNGYSLGSNAGTNGVLTGGSNPYLIQATINNSNTVGVDWGTVNPANNFRYGCYTNAEGVVGGETTQAVQVVTGVEMAIPLAALGSPTGAIAVCAFVANNGMGLQLSNQILGPLWDGTPDFCATGPGKTTNTWAPYLNLGTLPGTHYFYVGPEMRVTSVAVDSSKNVNVSYLTESSTNWTYQLQRAKVLSTNTTWVNVGGLTFGTGGIITETDTSGGTNKPGAFYRIRQTSLCQP
jgi:hypothetical protein